VYLSMHLMSYNLPLGVNVHNTYQGGGELGEGRLKTLFYCKTPRLLS